LVHGHSTLTKVKDEKRPWILRAREAAVQVDSTPLEGSSETWPETLIYISCGWDSFKKVKVTPSIPNYNFWLCIWTYFCPDKWPKVVIFWDGGSTYISRTQLVRRT
jgi:hypothetical protein